MSTITKTFTRGGVLTNMTSVKLSDSTGTYGVKRNDTDGVVVADGTAMTNSSTGVYTHTFDDPANGLTYTYVIEVVQGGETHHITYTLTGPTGAADDISITYVDGDGETQTLEEDTDYEVDGDGMLARVYPVYGTDWPTTRDQREAVTITWNAGYENAASVPEPLKAAIKLIVANLYENRLGADMNAIKPNPAVDALIGFYRIMEAH